MESQNYPAERWIDMWLGINFYAGGKCMQHKNKYKTVFCCTCTKKHTECEECWKSSIVENHKDHHYLKVRKASKRTAVDVGDITKHFSVSEIQTYSFNWKFVVYLNPSNDSPDKSKNCPYKCVLCKRKLIFPNFKFCSIACKKEAVGLKYNDGVSKSRVVSKVGRKRKVEKEEETNTTTMIAPSSPNEEKSSTKRPPKSRRKQGIPVRSPLK